MAEHRRRVIEASTTALHFGQSAPMALLFGIGTLFFAAILALRLLPKLVGLAFWLGSTAITGGVALIILYLLAQNP
jgi:hypothetical protein